MTQGTMTGGTQSCCLKLGDTRLHIQQSLENLIGLYNTWTKPEKAKEP